MAGPAFIRAETLIILGWVSCHLPRHGLRILFGKLLYIITAARSTADRLGRHLGLPMAARVVAKVGMQYNKKNYLLMHAMGANAGGQIGSVIAAASCSPCWPAWCHPLRQTKFSPASPFCKGGPRGIFRQRRDSFTRNDPYTVS